MGAASTHVHSRYTYVAQHTYVVYDSGMATRRIQSTELHRNTRDILDDVRNGATVIVELYGKPIAEISPYTPPQDETAPEEGNPS